MAAANILATGGVRIEQLHASAQQLCKMQQSSLRQRLCKMVNAPHNGNSPGQRAGAPSEQQKVQRTIHPPAERAPSPGDTSVACTPNYTCSKPLQRMSALHPPATPLSQGWLPPPAACLPSWASCSANSTSRDAPCGKSQAPRKRSPAELLPLDCARPPLPRPRPLAPPREPPLEPPPLPARLRPTSSSGS